MQRVTRHREWRELNKKADVVGTELMPLQSEPGDQIVKPSKTTLKKQGSDVVTNEGLAIPRASDKLPQARTLKPLVNVTGKEVPAPKEKSAQYYALPDAQRYPIDTVEQVKQAMQYWRDWHDEFDPRTRHQYCQQPRRSRRHPIRQ